MITVGYLTTVFPLQNGPHTFLNSLESLVITTCSKCIFLFLIILIIVGVSRAADASISRHVREGGDIELKRCETRVKWAFFEQRRVGSLGNDSTVIHH